MILAPSETYKEPKNIAELSALKAHQLHDWITRKLKEVELWNDLIKDTVDRRFKTCRGAVFVNEMTNAGQIDQEKAKSYLKEEFADKNAGVEIWLAVKKLIDFGPQVAAQPVTSANPGSGILGGGRRLSSEYEDPRKKSRLSYPDSLCGFWDALLRTELKDGCLILPEPYIWDGTTTNKVFVRDCYKLLADAILRDAGLMEPLPVESPGIVHMPDKKCWTVLGNPGIGKTMFLHYMTWRLRQIRTVECVIRERVGWAFVDFANEAIIRTKVDLPPETTPRRWILFDSTKDGPPTGFWPSILVTSPEISVWKQYTNQGVARKFIMPVWSFSDLELCRKHCFDSKVTEDVLRDNFSQWGGICRFVLEKPTPSDRTDLQKAIASANSNIKSLQSFASNGAEWMGNIPHKLLHFVVDEQFESVAVTFASRYVAEEVAKRIATERNMELRLLISGSGGVKEFGSLRGLLFEEMAHSDLLRGGTFSFKRLDAADACEQCAIQVNLKTVTFRTTEEFGQAASPGVYARPAAKNYATIDAVLVQSQPTSPVMFLQMTVSTSHPIKAAALQSLRNVLPPSLQSRPVQFVFVVPDDIASSFSVQPFHTVKQTVLKNPPQDVTQWLLVLPLAKNQ